MDGVLAEAVGLYDVTGVSLPVAGNDDEQMLISEYLAAGPG